MWAAFLVFALSLVLAGADASAQTPEDDARFKSFLETFKPEALEAGVSEEIFARAFEGVGPNPRVKELNEKQPEFVRPVWEYLDSATSDKRIADGRKALATHTGLFAQLEQSYSVPRTILTAIWGLESSYGSNIGSYNLFQSLATLAYEGPRMKFGREQLLATLKIAQQENLDPKNMLGSWAGAMGHTQFIPTTYLVYAVDGDGDGKRDLQNSPADALASAANYLSRSGWREGAPWGREVRLPENFPYEEADPENKKPVSQWSELGVLTVSGEALSSSDDEASIFLPGGYRGPAFLLRGNFGVILRYNFATSYALAIGLLSDCLSGAAGVQGAWPREEVPLDAGQRTTLQEGLEALGFDTGGADGILGRQTRAAIRAYQNARGLPADGFATARLLTRILNERAARLELE